MVYIYRYTITISTDTNDSCGRGVSASYGQLYGWYTVVYELRAYGAQGASDPGEYPEVYGRLAQGYFNRKAWTESIASANVSIKEFIIILVQQMFWCYENGDGNLAVAYASERYDV